MLNKRIKEYIETGDEFLLDDEVLTQIIKLIKYIPYIYILLIFLLDDEVLK